LLLRQADLENRLRALERSRGTPLWVTTFNF
jgi:hypothetical protein